MSSASSTDYESTRALLGGLVTAEIASQPDTWATAARLANTDHVSDALPCPGERVAVVGCGTSFYVAQACASLREGAGHGETDAFAASEYPLGRLYDRVVVVSRSGTTSEVLQLLHLLREQGAGERLVAITADPNTPILDAAGISVVLEFADEESVVQTRFATTTIALWRAGLGADLDPVITQARDAVLADLPDQMVSSTQFTFLGTGFSVGIANEAALKVREASQSWAESYPSMEFRHGPISVVDSRSTVWIFGTPPCGLVDDVVRTGAHVHTSGADPLADLVLAQRLAVELARRKGLDPDAPRNLTRSIIL